MFIGKLRIEIYIPEAASLKDKRHVVKSLIDSARSRWDISACELESKDKWQYAILAFVSVADSYHTALSRMETLEQFINRKHELEIINCEIEVL